MPTHIVMLANASTQESVNGSGSIGRSRLAERLLGPDVHQGDGCGCGLHWYT